MENSGTDDILASDRGKNDYNWLITPPTTPLCLKTDRRSVLNYSGHNDITSVRTRLKASKAEDSERKPSSRSEPPLRSVRGNLGLQQSRVMDVNGHVLDLPLDCSLKSAQCLKFSGNLTSQGSIHMGRLTLSGSNTSSRPLSSLQAIPRSPNLSISNRDAPSMATSMQPEVLHGRASSRPSAPVKSSPSPNHHCGPPSALQRSSSANSAPPTALRKSSSANRVSSMLPNGVTLSQTNPSSIKVQSFNILKGRFKKSSPNPRSPNIEKHSPSSLSSSNTLSDQEEALCRRKSGSPIVKNGRMNKVLQNGCKSLHGNTNKSPDNALSNGKANEKALLSTKKPTLFSKGQRSVENQHTKRNNKATSFCDGKPMLSSVRGSSGLSQNHSKKAVFSGSKHTNDGKSTPYNFRSFMSTISKSSFLPRRSGNKGAHRISSVSNSPMVSSASSEQNASNVIDLNGNELDESISEEGRRLSAVSQHDCFALFKERRTRSLHNYSECMDGDPDFTRIFDLEDSENLLGPESPVFSEIGGAIEFEDLCLGST
ncbi:hypothetical protein KP509_11G017000 [Ceratopteris richardii]|nr:hypothetical protein KP509_11G017000 [Ceratopteris richardii]